MEIKFGYWPCEHNLEAGDIQVAPLPEFRDVVEAVKASSHIDGDWIYPPRNGAFVPYQIPSTHVMNIANATHGREFGELSISILGLLEGMLLIPQEWKRFYRAAIKPNTLSDLLCSKTEIEEVLKIVQTFLEANSSINIRRNLFGAIHWLLFSQSYEQEFEIFAWQYIVMDTCFRLYVDINAIPKKQQPYHYLRPSFLANAYSIPEPSWAIVNGNECELSKLRNEFFHEGRYAGHPIGFALSTMKPNIKLQLISFNTRLILGILGVNCEYVRSRVDTRQMHGLNLIH